MINYKKIIPNQEIRFKILNMLRFIPDKTMIKLQYFIKTGRILNLRNPKRFTEKLQWYKLYYRDPLMTKCADKYRVREYVEEKGYGHILIPQYGVFNDAREIDFENLPNEFVLKTTNSSKTNIICEDKSQLDQEETIKLLNKWLNERPVHLGREWSYYDIEPKIICEKLLKDESDEVGDLKDYKFICFNGEAKYIWVDNDRFTNHTRNFFDTEWNSIDVEFNVPKGDIEIPKPSMLDEMLDIANALSRDFPHVRVDLYLVNGQIYFGEMTFYSHSGYDQFNPDEFDFHLGELFDLDRIRF